MISLTTSVGYLFLRSLSRSLNLSYIQRQCIRVTARAYAWVRNNQCDVAQLASAVFYYLYDYYYYYYLVQFGECRCVVM